MSLPFSQIIEILMLFSLFVAPLAAQRPLKVPLQFVPPTTILIVDPTENNIVHRAMRLSPFLTPQADTLSHSEIKALRKLFCHNDLPSHHSTQQLARLFLLSGDARFAEALDSVRMELSRQLHADSANIDLAQSLLNSIGWIAATGPRKVYINLVEDCLIPIQTPDLHFSIDQIREGNRIKLRIGNIGERPISFALYIRLPHGCPTPTFYINGHRLLDPKTESGYLVIDRAWRNREEVFYELGE